MKQRTYVRKIVIGEVAPFMGAWIETLQRTTCSQAAPSSLPSWERGLKHGCDLLSREPCFVAPFMGAWIETLYKYRMAFNFVVAPFMGAWIETKCYGYNAKKTVVAPFMGAWIETVCSP